MALADAIEISCPAKVNLALSVGSYRPQNKGLHPIASWMTAVSFADRMTVTRSPDDISQFDICFEDDAVGAVVDWPLEQDLAFRGHQLISEHVRRDLPVHMELRKRIPPGAGLGGGSSNAAAMIVALNRLYDLGLDGPVLKKLGGRLGSDVAFLVGAVLGETSALVTGLGITLDPVRLDRVLHLVIVLPPFGCATAQVYRAFDKMSDQTKKADTDRVKTLMRQRPLAKNAPFNDLAQPACRTEPRLNKVYEDLNLKLGVPVHITGSGSALFILAPSAITSQPLARKVTGLTGLRAIATRTI